MLKTSLALLHANNLCNRILDNHQHYPLAQDAVQLRCRLEVAAEELFQVNEELKEFRAKSANK